MLSILFDLYGFFSVIAIILISLNEYHSKQSISIDEIGVAIVVGLLFWWIYLPFYVIVWKLKD